MIHNEHLFPYKWFLKDGYPAKNISPNNCKVFGTFICGGGSSMGYKLAGYEHLGGVEIDKKIADVYQTNHNPKYLFNQDIREFNKNDDLPKELFNLDLLDGSPPCSTFSMAGSREKAWGKSKKFREGQANQVLDDLVFEYCDTILKLKPKVFLLENVKGIIQGNAKTYSKKIVQKMTKGGYNVQVFCLNAASMGVPQKRERVFFIGHKKEFGLDKLKLEFNERPIVFGDIVDKNDKTETLRDAEKKLWAFVEKGDSGLSVACERMNGKSSFFSHNIQYYNDVSQTITATNGGQAIIYDLKRHLNKKELVFAGSYPLDYNFKNIEPKYLIGMSVPPVFTAQIAHQIYLQWLSKI